MGSYLGIDAHCNAGLELAAIDAGSGELLWRDRCRLDARLLREAVGRAPRPCTVVLEQGELATWLQLVLSEACERLLVTDPAHNRLIATSPDKTDRFDALMLADLARGGYIRQVYQPPRPFVVLRLRVRHHYGLDRHLTAAKNQLKALYRQHGIPVRGSGVYTPGNRPAWLMRLPPHAREPAEDLYALIDVAQQRKGVAAALLQQAVRRFPPARRLVRIPQIGPVTAATFVAFVVSPDRFPSRSHLWSYCGFGLTRRSSGESTEPVRLRRRYNRYLKRVIKSTTERLIRRPDDPFAAAYQLRLSRGMLPRRAKLAIARKLIDVLTAVWHSQEGYNPDRIKIA